MRPAKATATASDPVKTALVALANPNKSAVLIVGPPGSGKSFVLGQIHAQMSRSSHMSNGSDPPVGLRPTDGTSDIALSKLLIPGLARVATSDQAPTLAESRAASTPPPVSLKEPRLLAIDDIDLFDDSSLSLLSQSLDGGSIRLASTARESQADGVLRLLRPIRPVVIVALPPWTRPELDAWTADRLGGVLYELTARRLLSFAGGNALCITELIDSGITTGNLQRLHGIWQWDGALQVPPMTQARIADNLQGVDARVRDVLATVALAGEVELDVLEATHGGRGVEQADDASLLHVDPSGRDLWVSVRRPLDGHVILQRMSLTHRRRLARELAVSLLKAAGETPETALRVARLSRLACSPVSAELRVPAAMAALRQHDPEFAESLLVEAPTSEAEVVDLCASALVAQGRLREAAARLAEPDIALAGPEPALGSGGRRAFLLLLETADAVAWRSRVALASGATSAPRDPYRAAARAWIGEELAVAVTEGTDRLRQGGRAQPDWQRALIATMAAHAQLGQVQAALSVAEDSDAIKTGEFSSSHRANLLAVLGLCHLTVGAVARAQRCAESLSDLGIRENWAYAFELGALLAGRCALTGAAPSRAVASLRQAAVAGGGPNGSSFRQYALDHQALAHAMAGHASESEASLLESDRCDASLRAPRSVVELTRLARAEILLSLGMHRAAAERAADVANRCRADGLILTELLALHLCARASPSSQVAVRLEYLARNCDFPLARTYAEHGRAAETGNAHELGRIAAEYDKLGMEWLAAETAARSLTMAGPRRANTWAIKSRRLLDRLDAHGDVKVPQWWRVGLEQFMPLSDREREVAELAVEGSSSPQIAAQLHLSRRTVENHLQHVYRKLGITRREDLAGALGSGLGQLAHLA